MFLDFVVGLGEQPLTQRLQNSLDSSPQFLDRDSSEVGGARGSVEFRDQLGRELFGMSFDQSHQT
jgi:hypothetical protein